ERQGISQAAAGQHTCAFEKRDLATGSSIDEGECWYRVTLRMACGVPNAGGRGAPATPAGVRIVVPLLSGGSLRSPPANFPSPRWGGVRCRIYLRNVTRISNYTQS